MMIEVVEVALPDGTESTAGTATAGYGRDEEEAIGNAGWHTKEDLSVYVSRWVRIGDEPSDDDAVSEKAAEHVCRFHADDDDELPSLVRDHLRSLLDRRLFAEAIRYTFDIIWDRGYELDLPPSQRKYLP